MGYNYNGELGDGTTTDSHVPKQIVSSHVTAISAGQAYSLFLESDGSLWGMGNNGGGQLGDGTQIDSLVPEHIQISVPYCELRMASLTQSGNDLLLNFTSQDGLTYTLLSTTDLTSGTWSPLATGIPGKGLVTQIALPNAFVQPRQFFRIQRAP
jgi:hypothetical protein